MNENKRVPITEQLVISAEEVETEIRGLVKRHSGEDLISALTAHCLETVVEVVMTKYQPPQQLGRLGTDVIALLQELPPKASE